MENKLYDNYKEKEKAVLIAADDGNGDFDAEDSLDELQNLAETAGAEVLGRMIQNRETVNRSMYFGKGKVEELKNFCEELGADSIICDDELSPSQTDYLEKNTRLKIMDRTLVILDIFARHAGSAEGKAQVELAQLKYNLSHLTGKGRELSRLGGGIGTRGPGEKKLETDRRRIALRISELNRNLREIEAHRNIIREKRINSGLPIIAFIGYTNSGKSTLMNRVTGADVLCENKLFATLDITTRQVKPTEEARSEYLFTDTVGFISKLPHGLIKAFRSTLEEVKYADILIHVADASNKNCERQMHIVYKLLDELGIKDKPIITVFNKIDKAADSPLPKDPHADYTLKISALAGVGIDELKETVEKVVKSFKIKIELILPYDKGSLLNRIYNNCEVISAEHRQTGTYIAAYVNDEYLFKLKNYMI